MKHKLELELDLITDLSPIEFASKVEQAVREVVEAVRASFGTELVYDIFHVLDGREVRFVMEPHLMERNSMVVSEIWSLYRDRPE